MVDKMNNLLAQFRLIFSQEMYEDCEVIGSLVYSSCSFLSDPLNMANDLTSTQLGSYYSFLIQYGDCFYYRQLYKRAQEIYENALIMKKIMNQHNKLNASSTSLTSSGGRSSAVSSGQDTHSDIEFKYRLHKCYVQLKMFREALSILESVNSKQRSAKIVSAMAKLYEKKGNQKAAGTCYKLVLKECPLSFVLIEHILSKKLLKFADVLQVIQSSGSAVVSECDWVITFVKGLNALSSQDAREAVQSFFYVAEKMHIHDDFHLGFYTSRAVLLRGHFAKAVKQFERLHAKYPSDPRFTDSYAYYLYAKEQLPELTNLVYNLESNGCGNLCQTWVALTYAAILQRKVRSGIISIAKRAVELDDSNLHAKLALANAHRAADLKRDAEQQLTKLIATSPGFYEAHDSLVQLWLKQRSHKQAASHTQYYANIFRSDPRFQLLSANVLRQNPSPSQPSHLEAAKAAYSRALKIEPTLPEACIGMAHVLVEMKRYQPALDVLNQSLELEPNSAVHQLMAECYHGLGQPNEAMYHLNFVTDSKSPEAQSLLRKIQSSAHSGLVAALSNPFPAPMNEDSSGDFANNSSNGNGF